MDISEQLRLKLAARDAADAAGLRLTPNARAAFDSYLISRGDVIVEREDGSFSMLGESLQDALLRLSKSPGTSIYFDNGGDDHAAVPAVGGDAPNHNGGGEAEYIAKAKKLNGLSDDEWHRLDGWKKATLRRGGAGSANRSQVLAQSRAEERSPQRNVGARVRAPRPNGKAAHRQ